MSNILALVQCYEAKKGSEYSYCRGHARSSNNSRSRGCGRVPCLFQTNFRQFCCRGSVYVYLEATCFVHVTQSCLASVCDNRVGEGSHA